jgi:hypothetical protein
MDPKYLQVVVFLQVDVIVCSDILYVISHMHI